MNRKQITGLIAATAAGLAAAIALTFPATASAYTPDQLPNMGYRVIETNLGDNCHDWQVSGYGASTDLGSDCDPGFQAALDGFVQATYPPLQPTTTAPATTEIGPAATAPATTTAAPATTTDPVATTAAPAPTDTTAPAATTPATTAACDVQCQIADLQSQINALRSELTQLVQILETWPNLDPGILAQLMAVGS